MPCSLNAAIHVRADVAVGTYLVRESTSTKGAYAISIKTDRGPQHCQILRIGTPPAACSFNLMDGGTVITSQPNLVVCV